jgi:arylsulfatase A-like enzyme
MPMSRPNFLLFISDQHRADHLSCYGNAALRTPHIDSIAANGTRFERFHVATPICMPNRATLMTGRMPSLHGARQNGIPLSLNATTFVDLLAAAGYRTALIGKCHLQSMSPTKPTIGMPEPEPTLISAPTALQEADKSIPRHGRYDQELASNWKNPKHDLDLPYYGFQHVELCVNHGDKVVGHYSRWLAARNADWEKLRGPDNQLAGNTYVCPQAWRTGVPEELYPTAYIAERTEDYLQEHARGRADKPFFIQCSFPDPHHPFTPPGRYWDMYKPDDIELPRSFGLGDDVPPHLAHILNERKSGQANLGGQRAIAVNEREAREATALTYGMIAMIDDAIGRILATLRKTGLAENTVVVFTTDHGDFMGDHRLLLKGALHYRSLVRVPFIWSDPAAPHAAARSDALCGTLDIARTVLGRAGIAAHNGIQGTSLDPAGMDGIVGHDSLLIEEHQRRGYMGMPNNFRARSLITARHRLTLYEGMDWGELYDLEDDPIESTNLWSDPLHRALRSELMEQLVRKMMALSDTSPLATHHGP